MAYPEYYTVLGVEITASAEDIKKKYHYMAKKYHPDLNAGNKAAEEKFKQINEAYETLGDPDKRKDYDFFGKQAEENARRQKEEREAAAHQTESQATAAEKEIQEELRRAAKQQNFEEMMQKSNSRYIRFNLLRELRNRLLLMLLFFAYLYWCILSPADFWPQKLREGMFAARSIVITYTELLKEKVYPLIGRKYQPTPLITVTSQENGQIRQPQRQNTAQTASAAGKTKNPWSAKKAEYSSKEILSQENDFRQAVSRNDVKKVKNLLDRGLNPDLKDDKNGYTLLMRTDNLLIAEMLIKAGANVNYEAPDGQSALSLAVKNNQALKVRLLMKYGAKVNWKKI